MRRTFGTTKQTERKKHAKELAAASRDGGYEVPTSAVEFLKNLPTPPVRYVALQPGVTVPQEVPLRGAVGLLIDLGFAKVEFRDGGACIEVRTIGPFSFQIEPKASNVLQLSLREH